MKFADNRFFKTILPNIAIVLSSMMITLFILDYYNPLMGFLSRGMSIGVIVAWIAAAAMYLIALCVRVIMRIKAGKQE